MGKRMRKLAAMLAVVVLVFASVNVQAFAAGETANVTVIRTKDLDAQVYNYNFDTGTTTFVPVGETVQIPVGTELTLSTQVMNEDFQGEGEFQVTNSKTPGKKTYNNWDLYTVEPGNITITVVPKASTQDDPSQDYPSGRYVYPDYQTDRGESGLVQKAILRLIDVKNGTELKGCTWTLDQVQDPLYKNSLFTLTPDGVLTSKAPLEAGEYPIVVTWERNGEEGKDLCYPQVGYTVYYTIALRECNYVGGSYIDGWGHYIENQIFFGKDTTLGEALAKMNPIEELRNTYAMYGGYTLKAEFYDEDGNKITTANKEPMDDYKELYVYFEKNGVRYLQRNGSAPAPAVDAPVEAAPVTTQAPKTGDSTPLGLYLCLMVVGISGILILRKRRGYESRIK